MISFLDFGAMKDGFSYNTASKIALISLEFEIGFSWFTTAASFESTYGSFKRAGSIASMSSLMVRRTSGDCFLSCSRNCSNCSFLGLLGEITKFGLCYLVTVMNYPILGYFVRSLPNSFKTKSIVPRRSGPSALISSIGFTF